MSLFQLKYAGRLPCGTRARPSLLIEIETSGKKVNEKGLFLWPFLKLFILFCHAIPPPEATRHHRLAWESKKARPRVI
ncbi:MAG: hypothetical protein KAI76_08745 [Alphaproteobacteria bacterium]|nr:hypothetical protein [Alphaproteobacteria bacterium]